MTQANDGGGPNDAMQHLIEIRKLIEGHSMKKFWVEAFGLDEYGLCSRTHNDESVIDVLGIFETREAAEKALARAIRFHSGA